MITPWTIYWLTRLDAIHDLIGVLALLLICCLIGLIIAACSKKAEGEDPAPLWVWLRKALLAIVILGVVEVPIPKTKEAAAMLVIPKIANSDTAQELAGLGKDIVGLAKEWITELKPKSTP